MNDHRNAQGVKGYGPADAGNLANRLMERVTSRQDPVIEWLTQADQSQGDTGMTNEDRHAAEAEEYEAHRAPDTYMGVPVPMEHRHHWDHPYAAHWRRGVRTALESTEDRVLGGEPQ